MCSDNRVPGSTDGGLGPQGVGTVCEVCQVELDRISEVAQLTEDIELLRQPRRRINANIPVRMDDGSIDVFPSFRIQYNGARGRKDRRSPREEVARGRLRHICRGGVDRRTVPQ